MGDVGLGRPGEVGDVLVYVALRELDDIFEIPNFAHTGDRGVGAYHVGFGRGIVHERVSQPDFAVGSQCPGSLVPHMAVEVGTHFASKIWLGQFLLFEF